MKNTIEQSVFFVGGAHDKKQSTIHIPLPFRIGMRLLVDGELYEVRNGPIASVIERTQEPVSCGVVVLIPTPFLGEDEC